VSNRLSRLNANDSFVKRMGRFGSRQWQGALRNGIAVMKP
jgi:hypothetical protein